MKKLVICVLIVLLILPPLRFASADCNESQIDDPILERFIGLLQATAAISASGNMAKCQGVARAKSNEYSLQVTMTLQRKSFIVWKSVTSWNGTGIGYVGVTLSESESGLSAGTYRTKLYAQVVGSEVQISKAIQVVPKLFTEDEISSVIKLVFGNNIDFRVEEIPTQGEISHENGLSFQYLFYENYIFVQECPEGVIQLEDWIKAGNAYPGEPKGSILNNVFLTQDEAEQQALEIIEKISAEHLALSFASKARIILPSYETYSEGWFLSYGNMIDAECPPIYIASVFPNNRINVITRQTAPWLPQTLSFYIDKTGVRAFQWADPIVMIQGTEASKKTMSFTKIQDKIISCFRNNFIWDFVQSEDDIPIIEKVMLTTVLVKDKTNSVSVGKLQSAWAVYYTSKAEKENFSNPSIVFFDAVTGEIINPFDLDERAYQ